MCGLAGAGDWSLVKASLLIFFYAHCFCFFFPLFCHIGPSISSFLTFWSRIENSLCLAFRSVNSEISDFFKLSMQGICRWVGTYNYDNYLHIRKYICIVMNSRPLM